MTFSAILTALGLKPKNLEEARAAMEPAKATLDSVSALFTAAGLNLETMLAAGPDALKAHLASIDNTAEVTRLTGELSAVSGQLSASKTEGIALNSQLSALNSSFALIGINTPATATAADLTKAFNDYVSKQTTLSLAKTGHPPAHVPAAVETTVAATPEAIYAEYLAMPLGDARTAFYVKNDAAIWAGKKIADAKK